jgi:tetratricopeptide (TPR) repeat protein
MNRQNRISLQKATVTAALCILLAAMAGCTNEKYEDELSYRSVGIEAMETGDYESAVAAFNAALSLATGKITDTEKDICYYKAAALYALDRADEAMEVYDALIDYDAKNADAYYMRGCLKLQNWDTEGAAADYDLAVKYNSSDYELYINIYDNFSGADMAETGENYLEQAFSVKGDDAENLAYRGKIYYLLGQYDNAATELISAINKGSVDANLTMASVCDATGDTETAAAYYQTYVESQEGDSSAMNELAEFEMGREDYAQALIYIEKGLSMESVPNRKELMSNQIICMEQTTDFAGAWEVIQEYVTLYPDDLDAQREYTFLKYRNVSEETENVTEEET